MRTWSRHLLLHSGKLEGKLKESEWKLQAKQNEVRTPYMAI